MNHHNDRSLDEEHGPQRYQQLLLQQWQMGGPFSILGTFSYSLSRWLVRLCRDLLRSRACRKQHRWRVIVRKTQQITRRCEDEEHIDLLDVGEQLSLLISQPSITRQRAVPELPFFSSWHYRHVPERRDLGVVLSNLGTSLQRNTPLRHLILENIDLFAVPFPVALAVLATGIVTSNVHSLRLQHWSYNCERSRDLYFEFIRDVLVAATTSLTTLELANTKLGDMGMLQLSHGIKCNSSLTELVLQECNMGNAGLRVLFSEGISHSTTVTNLTLETCNIQDDDIPFMVEHWHTDSPIQRLSLPGNNIGRDGAQAIVRAARHHSRLQTLDLSSNRSMGYEALMMIGKEIHHYMYLTSVGLENCSAWMDSPPLDFSGSSAPSAKPDDARGQELKARDVAADALLEAVQSNLHLTYLNLEGNGFPINALVGIDFHLASNRTGGPRLAREHTLASSLWSYMLAKCQRRLDSPFGISLVYFYLREHPELVQPCNPLTSCNAIGSPPTWK